MSVPALPNELLVIILRHVYVNEPSQYLVYLGNGEHERSPLTTARETLKRLRLVSSAFRDALTPAVFASIHLHGSDLSIARAESIANSYLATYVKEIVFHAGTFSGRSPGKKVFQSTLTSHRRRQDYPHTVLGKVNDDELYRNYLEEIHTSHSELFCSGANFVRYSFSKLISQLPNLKSICAVPYHDDFHDPETSAYTLRRTGLAYLPDPDYDSSPTWWCDVLAAFSPIELNLAICPNKISGKTPLWDPSYIHDNCRRLTFLKLGPVFGARYGFGMQDTGIDWHSEMTRLLIAAGKSLTHLELTNDYAETQRFLAPPTGSLPKLTHLTFSAPSTRRDWPSGAIFKIVRVVGQSLKHLHFHNLRLRNVQQDSNLGYSNALTSLTEETLSSVISLCGYIRFYAPYLESCTGLDTIYDVKSSTKLRSVVSETLPGNRPGREILCKKLEEATCNKREWPRDFEHRLQPVAGVYRGTDPAPERVERRLERFLNDTWEDTIDEFELHDEMQRGLAATLGTDLMN